MGASKDLSYLFIGVSLVLPFEYLSISHFRKQILVFLLVAKRRRQHKHTEST